MSRASAYRVWATAILLAAVAVPPLACHRSNGQAPQSTTQDLLERAHALEVRGRVDLAAQRWQQVLLVDPNNKEALGGLARAAKSAGKLGLAQSYLDRLRAIDPHDPGIARAEEMGTAQDNNAQLQQAGNLAQQGQYAQAMNIYRQVYGGNPPPGDAALSYYETESATEEGRPHAIQGLRGLAEKYPNDIRYRISLGRILTYNPKTRAEGRHLLEQFPKDPQAVEALRQSLLWDAQNPATAGNIREYLKRHPDNALEAVLKNEPRTGRTAPLTKAEAEAAAVNATRGAEDREAYRLLNEKRLEEAELAFKAILAKTPDDANALAGMGYIRMQQANFGGAISFLVQAKQDGSRDPGLDSALATSRFWYTMGEGAIALNDNDAAAAEREYRAALQMRPNSPDALEGLGGTLAKEQQFEAATVVFKSLIKLKPNSAPAWRGLFLAEAGTGNNTEALAIERRIPKSVRPELARDAVYLRALASALSAAGRDADAQKVLAQALNLPFSPASPTVNSDTKLQYAALLLQANRFEQAAGLYREVLAKDPNNVAAYQGLVRVRHSAGQDDQALATIDAMPPEVYSNAMKDGGFDITVASIFESQHRLDVAQDILEKTLQVEGSQGAQPSVDVRIQLAGIYLQRGDPQQAFPLYRQILSQNPNRLDAWKGLLDSLHITGRDAEALAQIQQMPPTIRQQLENDVSYLQTVGAIYNALGQPQEAQLFLNRVQAHYAGQHIAPPADVDIQNAWLLYNGGADTALWRQLMALGARTDLTDAQRMTVQTIWTNFSVRRASQAEAAGDDRKAIEILNANANAFPGNPAVVKALAGGYARAGMAKEAVAIWKSIDLRNAAADDYRSAVGAALVANDQKDAENWLRFGLNKYPRNAELLLLGAKFEQQRGDINRARDYYKASLKAMPADDPGAALALELSRPATPAPALPGSSRSQQALSNLLAPGTEPTRNLPSQPASASQPYLPGGSNPNAAPVQLDRSSDLPSYGGQTVLPSPDSGSPQPPAPASLRNYVPQAAMDRPCLPHAAKRYNCASKTAPEISREDLPLLLPASFQPRPIVRSTERPAISSHPAASRRVLTEYQVNRPPLYATAASGAGDWPELSQGATFRATAFVSDPRQAQQAAQNQTMQAQPAQPAPAQPQSPGGIVYGPYVPYVPPARRLTAQPQNQNPAAYQSVPAQQPTGDAQIPQPSRPLTSKPAAPANGTLATDGVVYGPYVPYVAPAAPYVPPAATAVRLGATPPTRQIGQPEVTDVLPTAKQAPNDSVKVPGASHPNVAAGQAAAARRRAAARAAAISGVSRPPVEVYETPAIEPAQYTTPPPAVPVATPPPASVYVKPYMDQGVQSVATPGSNGDSSAQQYPQPEPRTVAPARRSGRARREVAAAPAPLPAQTPSPAPALSYPGVGSPLGYQPYPAIGPAYPLPPAPTDRDLMEKQVPPLRGSYYTGEVLAPTVPLTERQQTERDLAALEASYSGWVGGTGTVRYRSGTVGYDRLTDLEASFEASYVANNSVRFSIVPKAVFLNSGQLNASNFNASAGSPAGAPVLGTYNSGTATNNPSEQFANGIGGELQAAGHSFAVAVGYTPYEFLVENLTWRALWRPTSHFTLYANRDAVNETQLSYAGLRDPGSTAGNIWGGVVATGGGARFDLGDEKAGFYLTADGADLTGYHVLENTKFEGSMGAYFLAHTFPGYGRLNVGVSLFGMHYANEERQLSYGLGGYFSPDAYILASVPVTFVGRYGSNFHYTIAGAVGVQTFQEDSQVYFPLDRPIETSFQTAANCTTATILNHTCGQYPVNSNTGGNYSINTEGAYRVADHWYAGGFLSANNTNNYNTVSAGFFVRYLFRPQVGTDDYPTGLFPVEGFRPLRVP